MEAKKTSVLTEKKTSYKPHLWETLSSVFRSVSRKRPETDTTPGLAVVAPGEEVHDGTVQAPDRARDIPNWNVENQRSFSCKMRSRTDVA